MRCGMATLPEDEEEDEEEETMAPVLLLTELMGDGLRDMGDGVPVVLTDARGGGGVGFVILVN